MLSQDADGVWRMQPQVWGNSGGIVKYPWTVDPVESTSYGRFREAGAVSREHLNYYLDEFTFRFNRRSSRSRGLLFYRLLEQAAQTPHTPTDALFLATGRGPR